MVAGAAGPARLRGAAAGDQAPDAPEAPAEGPASPGDAIGIDFDLPLEAAARLARLPALAAWRSGSARSSKADRIWFDTADGRLAAAGLVVEKPARGPRLLVRTRPAASGPWHPGRPAEVLRSLPDDDLPTEAGGDTLAAIAAFAGRQQTFRLALPEGEVQAVLLAGELRSVAAGVPAARLGLSGPPAAVVAAARAIAAELPLLPQRTSLADDGRAIAANAAPRAPRLGAPDTSAAATAEDAFAQAFGHLLEVIRQQSARIAPEAPPEPVHQTRVALRRLRSVFRVFRPVTDCAALRALDARLREVLAVLGPARDWDVFLGGLLAEIGAAFPEDRRIAGLRRAAEAERRTAYAAVATMLGDAAWRLLMIDALGTLLARPWRDGAEAERLAALDAPVEAYGKAVLDRRWHRLRRAGNGFEDLSAEALHELRLDGKRLRYAAEVFAPVFGAKAGRRFLKRVAALQDGLGLANDAAVARGLAARLAAAGNGGRAWAVGAVEGWCAARLAASRDSAHAAWSRLHGKDRFWSGD